jgi:hypothetical protein
MLYMSETDRLRACTLTRNEKAGMLPASSCRDLVAVVIKYKEKGVRHLVVCSAYLPYNSEDTPLSKGLENSCDTAKLNEAAPKVTEEGRPW